MQVTTEWLAKENDGRIRITAKPSGAKWSVSITLLAGHRTKKDEGDSSSRGFSFTIDKGQIVESVVMAPFAG